MLDLLRTLADGFPRLARRAAEIGWYIGFPISFFKLVREVLLHWRTGTFSGEDALLTLALVMMVWFAFRFVGIPLGGSLLAIAYIAYSLEGGQ
ncbi:hypothetical protein [Thermus sp.]